MFLSSKWKKEIEDLFRRAPAPDLVDGRRCPKPLSNSTSSPNHVKSITASPSSRRRISATSTIDSPAAKALSRVDVLSEELPFIQRFKGKTVVVKYGGAAMKSPELQASVIRDLVLLSCVGLRPILVHGGGPEINSWPSPMRSPWRSSRWCSSARSTRKSRLPHKCRRRPLRKGHARLITARPSPNVAALGFVDEVARVDATVLHPIIASGHIPVIATVAADETGQAYNINADTAAGEIAAAVGAEKLLLLTDVSGPTSGPQ
ncbi:hypothetical protein QYE76_037787 [Lolium multiflorum]|uniref:Aspartate/glutamate/uridylate kinase domain-containing protein n=1 Tax=Lolium multiflorum TaxID=4521 RepID=A0AAD8QF89_LOLMU|nr:hypothetical protein QYE76_037787 [Lolium multiflorum]